MTADADTENAQAFVKYSMDEGYTKTLSIAPEGKFPVRRGDESNPNKFLDAWAKLPVGVDRKAPLSDIYPPEVIKSVVSGLEAADRWGVEDGQLSLASKIVNSQIINRLMREYIDGERSAEETVSLMNEEIAKIN